MPDILKNFKKANPDGSLVEGETFIYDGTLLITEEGIAAMFDVTVRAVLGWKKKGMQVHRTTAKGAKVYNVVYVIKWYENNFNKTIESQFQGVNEADLDISKISREEADRRLQIQKVKNEEIKHQELIGKLVPAEDLDRAMAEQAILHRTFYQDDLECLPPMLEKLDKSSMRKVLEDHYSRRMDNATEFIKKTYGAANSFHKKIMEFIDE